MYSKIIKQYPLLNREEEVALVQAYDRVKPFCSYSAKGELIAPVCPSPELKKGLKAREKLILSNIRLVLKIASKTNYHRLSITKEDLISTGIYGLSKAADRFDLSFNTRFSTYAYWIIYQQIRSIIYTATDLKMHSADLGLFWKIRKAATELQQNNKPCSASAIADFLEIPISSVTKFSNLVQPLVYLDAKQPDDSDLELWREETAIEDYDYYYQKVDNLKVLDPKQKTKLKSFIDNQCKSEDITQEIQNILTILSLSSDLPLFA